MKKSMHALMKLVEMTAQNALKKDANSTTCVAVYQPVVPDALKRFKNTK